MPSALAPITATATATATVTATATTTAFLAAAFAAALTLAACGNDADSSTPVGDRTTADVCPPREPASADLLDRLRAAPCVAQVTELAAQAPGARAFDVFITQLVDHQDPASATFEQQITLVVVDETAPTILASTGYDNYQGQYPSELTQLWGANQLVVEHRNFGASIPSPPAWEHLTIANAADDHHQIVAALAPILTGAWISTGASKGGMTSVYHRRFWPHDVAGTVAYVAPLSLGAPDPQYVPFVAAIGTEACRDALDTLTRELLANRREAFEARAAAQADDFGFDYTRVALPAAVEWAMVNLAWTFWQYLGVAFCGSIPEPTASDDEVWAFVEQVTGTWMFSDGQIEPYEAYYYQAAFQLGFPDEASPGLGELVRYGPTDYAGLRPLDVETPTYAAAAMADIDAWVQAEGERILFVYGAWDPWSGGPFHLGASPRDSAIYTVPEGTHGANISQLDPADRDDAIARLTAWTQVTPQRVVAPLKPLLPRMRQRPPALR